MSTEKASPLTATPAVGQLVEHENKIYETIREGRAYILIPPNTRTSVDPKLKTKADIGKDVPQGVFYNPIQQFNRDLSVLAIKAFGEDLCAKRTAQHERGNSKQLAKNERKRKRKSEAKESRGRESVEQKLDKESDGHNADHDGVAVGLPMERDGSAAGNDEASVTTLEQAAEGASEPATKKRKADKGRDLEGEAERPEKLRTIQDEPNDNANMDSAEPEQPQQDPVEEASESAAMSTINGTNGQPFATVAAARPEALHTAAVNGSATIANEDLAETPQEPTTNIVETPPHPPVWKPRFRILDALSATGLRALRYAAEIPSATAIVANDMDRNAVKSIRAHVEHNKLAGIITASHNNAIGHMYSIAFPPTDSHGPSHISGKYDVIDLDPYGTAAPFIDSAMQALNDGGLLCVTCTDSGVFASCGYAEKTYSLYGGMPIKGPHSHEGGLRLIINSVASAAAKYGLAVEPLLSLSIDFYVRIFIRVNKSPADVKFLAGKTMLVYDCDAGCGSWHTQMLGRNTRQTGKGASTNPTFNFKHGIAQGPSSDRLCEHCGSKMHVAGPMWGGPMHNAAFVEKLLRDVEAADKSIYHTTTRLEGMLDTALNELEVIPETSAALREASATELIPKTPPEAVDLHPFFFIPSALAKVIHCIAPSEVAIKGALRHAGYRATRSHCKPGSIKTDAPWSAIWEIMREWVRQKQPTKEGSLKESNAGWKIMQAARKPEDEGNGGAEAANGETTAEMSNGLANDKRIKVVFDEVLGRDKTGKKIVRYAPNPRGNWGPMTKAKGSG
ncbi:RNA methyltransferase tRNA(m5U54)methyltransferase [Teratosphaeriaceae sp. CCFEE 6253]|nr:RNA methyltransferase tRNA(m5U54)methyltransferase [Teratosphaeriaceae sp. CCFEE 6253]